MLTPAYAMTATERVLPRLALDFTTGVLDPRVTVTRALNTATRINNSGLVEGVNANLPRFDYDPATLAPKGLLIEEARTNDIIYAAGVAGTGWQTSQAGTATIATTLNYASAPDGTTTATRVIFNNNGGTGTGNFAWFGQSIPARLIGTSYADSIWLKTNDNSTVTLLFRDDTGSRFNQLITVTGTWTRFSLAGVSTAVGTQCCKIWIRSGVGTSTFADISAWGGQSEAGTFSTSYIPTTLLPVLRNADAVSMTGTNFSDWYNASEGALLVETLLSANVDGAVGNYYAAISDGTVANTMHVVDVNGTVSQIVTGGVTQFSQTIGGEPVGISKSGFAYQLNNAVSAANSVIGPIDTNVLIPTVNRLTIGARADLSNISFLNGYVLKLNYWPQRLTNAEMQAFTKG